MNTDKIQDLTKQTVQTIPDPVDSYGTSLTHYFTTAVKNIEPWGKSWQRRDEQLAKFWPEESYLSSAVYSIASARSAFSFEVKGPPKTAARVMNLLHSSNFGSGWINLQLKLALSVLTQDNGGFLEVIRDEPRRGQKPESAPVIGLSVLAPNRCIRTGNPLKPVIYTNEDGKVSILNWYEVVTFEDFPSVDPIHRGRQYSFVTRVLRAAEIISEITTYKHEKVSGQFARAMHLIGGVSKNEIDSAARAAKINADNTGLVRYMEPIVLASLDPNATVSHVRVDLATLPDAFDEDVTLKWYITLMAMAAGSDYQEFGPLPGGNLGTGSQSEVLHRKSQAKGHALWMKMLEHKLQNSRVIPQNVSFEFMAQDAIAEFERVRIGSERGKDRASRIASGEITPQVAQLIAVADGDLDPEYLPLLGNNVEQDTVTITDEDVVPTSKSLDVEKLPLSVTSKAAKWVRQIIENSKFQALSKLSDGQLNTFEQSLRNKITYEKSVGTSEFWQDYAITAACYDAGIHPHNVRQRLPDNYRLILGKEGISDNRGSLIYRHITPVVQKEIHSNKSLGVVCYQCGKEKSKHIYRLNSGWLPVCDRHITSELEGENKDYQYSDLESILNAYRTKAETIKSLDINDESRYNRLMSLSGSALSYALISGIGRDKHTLNAAESSAVKSKLQAVSGFVLLNSDIVQLSIIDLFYKGLTLRI